MSVLVLDLEVYEAIYEKAIDYTFRNVCDINFCSVLKHKTENQLKKIVFDWLYLNELSYNRRYREENEPHLNQFLKFKSNVNINTYQMLKYLECIKYNIELDTIETGFSGTEKPIKLKSDILESYEVLKLAIEEIKTTIISSLPEYKIFQCFF